MGPENTLNKVRVIRDAMITTEHEARLQLGEQFAETVADVGYIHPDNPVPVDPTMQLSAHVNIKRKLQVLESMLTAVRSAKPCNTIENGALFTIQAQREINDDEGKVLEDLSISGTYFYVESGSYNPKDPETRPFNGEKCLPDGTRIMLRRESLLTTELFFRSEGEEFDYHDEKNRQIRIKVISIE